MCEVTLCGGSEIMYSLVMFGSLYSHPQCNPLEGVHTLLRALFHTLLSQRTLSGSLWVFKLSILGARQAVKELP